LQVYFRRQTTVTSDRSRDRHATADAHHEIHHEVSLLRRLTATMSTKSGWASDANLISSPQPSIKLTFPDPSGLSTIEKAKRLAAHAAVHDHFPRPARVVGIGSGSTIVYAVEKILQLKDLENVVFVPTGFQSRELIVQGGLRLGEISEYILRK